MFQPFIAAYYAAKHRDRLSTLAVPDLDSAERVWGFRESPLTFRNILVGDPAQRGEIWQSWISSGQIEISDDPSFYILQQEQVVAGKRINRWAFYASISVHDPQLYIHEDVLPEGVERARLGMESCEGDMAPIFVGCDESLGANLRTFLEKACEGKAPLLDYNESVHAHHRIWEMTDKSMQKALQQMMLDSPLFLLDGHHRLAAAKENDRLGIGDGQILICLSSLAMSDTLILPIHRAIYSERWLLPEVLTADLLREGCKVSEIPGAKPAAISELLEKIAPNEPSCILLHSHGNKPYLVRLPEMPSLPPTLADLAVARLDYGFLARQSQTIPVPSPELALEQLALDQAQAVFFLPAASPAQVRAVALAKLKMPRKSTRFVPKPALGLITRPWAF